jgi:parallel beta-helix repeat protein
MNLVAPTRPSSILRRLVSTAVTGALASAVVLLVPAGTAAAATAVAQDGFDRTTAKGWGSASSGGAWSVVGGTSSSTAGSAALVKGVAAGHSLRAALGSVSVADVNVRAAFTVPSTKDFYFSVEGRRQSDGSAYRGRARVDAQHRVHAEVVRLVGGSEQLLGEATTPTTVSAGQQVTVELLVTGSSPVTVSAKAYRSGTSAPDWQVTRSDSGSTRISSAGKVGVYAYNSPGNAATNVSTTAFSAWGQSVPSAPATPAQAAPAASTSTGHGSAAIGSTSYAVPSGAVFVATNGNDASAGTAGAPLRTVTKALSKVKGGGTVVLRGGTYHEYFIVPPGKNVAIQSYPKEAVWFDGSSTVTGFKASGGRWVVGGWTSKFDSSPTYTKGAADGTAAGWQFVNPDHPMAAHPDAVWINGAEQTQVGSLSQVKAGTFFVDYGSNQLWLGSDPGGKTVQASTLAQAVSLRAPGTTLRGIGFRRYADSVWQQGVITAYYPNQTLENVVVADSATAGIGFFKPGSTLRNVTVTGSGQLGIQAGLADGLMVDNVLVQNSNDQSFNPAPSAGGFKVTMTRGFTMKNSVIENTNGNQFWTDQSTYDINLLNNTIRNGTRWGIVLEISSTATVANNVITGNAFDGVMVSDTDHVNIWNNTIVGNSRAAIATTQDTRRITQLNVSGHDPRRTQPDTSMPWVVRGTTIGNNILSGNAAGTDPILRAQAWDRVYGASDMVASSNGNVFSQTAAGKPGYVTVWGKKGTWATNYATLAAYTGATGYDRASYSLIGTSPVSSTYGPSSAVSARESSVAQPLPSSVAGKVGVAAGTKHLGAWR